MNSYCGRGLLWVFYRCFSSWINRIEMYIVSFPVFDRNVHSVARKQRIAIHIKCMFVPRLSL